MADKKRSPGEPVPVAPVFKITRFGIGDMYTRKGHGLIDDDLPSDLASAKPGRYGAHHREDTDVEGHTVRNYCKGGKVISSYKGK
jgi:hypothetical protein